MCLLGAVLGCKDLPRHSFPAQPSSMVTLACVPRETSRRWIVLKASWILGLRGRCKPAYWNMACPLLWITHFPNVIVPALRTNPKCVSLRGATGAWVRVSACRRLVLRHWGMSLSVHTPPLNEDTHTCYAPHWGGREWGGIL